MNELSVAAIGLLGPERGRYLTRSARFGAISRPAAGLNKTNGSVGEAEPLRQASVPAGSRGEVPLRQTCDVAVGCFGGSDDARFGSIGSPVLAVLMARTGVGKPRKAVNRRRDPKNAY
jgi:hypothetical protein